MKKTTKLYRHWNNGGRLLYVGVSHDAIKRLAQHEADKEWQSEIARVTIDTYPTREAAEQAEREAVRNENPLHNRICFRPKNEIGLPQPRTSYRGFWKNLSQEGKAEHLAKLRGCGPVQSNSIGRM